MPPVIEVSHLTKQFKDITAVNDLSFTVRKGDVYGFLGQNGAGKSTTIRMLLTLVESTSGTINIFNKNLNTNREEILSKIGAVIEKPDLYKFLTAYENLSQFAKISGVSVPKSRIMEQLEMVDLAERADSKVKTFSQGMKQRLGIAVALVHDPELIILDEPTNGLDPQGIADMRNLITGLSKTYGKTVLISSHLLNEIELIANRILIIDKGKKIIEGTADELLDPAKTIVEIEVTDVAGAISKLAQSNWNNFLHTTGEILQFRISRDQVPVLISDLVQREIDIISVQPRHSLENYFLSLTSGTHVEVAAI